MEKLKEWVTHDLKEEIRQDIEDCKPKNKRQRVFRITALIFIVIVFIIFGLLAKAFMDKKFNSVESLQAYIDGYGAWGPLALTIFQLLQVIIPVLPGFLGCAAGSILFGPFVGFWCNYIGISAGSIISFFLARKFGQPLLQDLFPTGKYRRWSEWASRSKSYTAFLFMGMVLPLFPDDYFCYLTGVTKMKPLKFIWIILLGKPWCILAYCLGFSMIK